MTNEGVFPKIDGDVLYASEANRFAGAGRALFAGSFPSISATGEMGSIVIGAGSLSNSAWIQGFMKVGMGDTQNILVLRVSGAQGYNTGMGLGSNVHNGNILVTIDMLLGSPSAANIMAVTSRAQDAMSTASIQHASSALSNNTNIADSGLVIFFGGSIIAGAMTINGYNLQSFRGAT